jgi:hypothetical protein
MAIYLDCGCYISDDWKTTFCPSHNLGGSIIPDESQQKILDLMAKNVLLKKENDQFKTEVERQKAIIGNLEAMLEELKKLASDLKKENDQLAYGPSPMTGFAAQLKENADLKRGNLDLKTELELTKQALRIEFAERHQIEYANQALKKEVDRLKIMNRAGEGD